jgi:hypothetical protein
MREYTMSVKEANKIFDKIENYSTEKIDGMILACAMRFIYYAGLNKNEIPLLTIGEVYDKNSAIRDETKKLKIPLLPIDFRVQLGSYYGYLKSKGMPTTPTDPLFPGYDSNGANKGSIIRRIDRNLKTIDSNYDKLIHDLREKGIKDCFQRSKKSANALADTAKQFHMTVKSVRNSIGGAIPPPGNKALKGVNLLNNQMVKLIGSLYSLDYTDIKNIKDDIDNFYNKITSLPDKNLKKLDQGSKVGAFKRYLIELLKEWK